jgi:hypothetical protein
MRPMTTTSRVAVLSLAVAGSLALLPPALAAGAKTSKERLSDKASDEQRVDNCRVPLDRRGPTPRPDCPTATETAEPMMHGSTGDVSKSR